MELSLSTVFFFFKSSKIIPRIPKHVLDLAKLQHSFFQIFLLENLHALILIQSTMIMIFLCCRLFFASTRVTTTEHEHQNLTAHVAQLVRRATHRIMENAPDLESGQCGFESRRVIRCRFKSCHGQTFYHLFKIYLSRAEIQNLHEYALSSPSLSRLSSSTVNHYFLDIRDVMNVMIFFLT